MAVAGGTEELAEGELGKFAQYSPSVTLTGQSQNGAVNAILGGHDYSAPVQGAYGAASGEFIVSYTPCDGTCRLLFGEVANVIGASNSSPADFGSPVR